MLRRKLAAANRPTPAEQKRVAISPRLWYHAVNSVSCLLNVQLGRKEAFSDTRLSSCAQRHRMLYTLRVLSRKALWRTEC